MSFVELMPIIFTLFILLVIVSVIIIVALIIIKRNSFKDKESMDLKKRVEMLEKEVKELKNK